MLSIDNYIPKTNYIYTVYSVGAVLYLQSVLHVMLFPPYSMFCTFTSTIPPVCVQRTIWLVSVIPRFRAFSVCCSETVWVILRRFWSSCYCRYHICFHIPHMLNFYFKVLVIYNFLSFFLDYISVCRNLNIYWHACYLFIITNFDVQFIARNNFVGLHPSFRNRVNLPY